MAPEPDDDLFDEDDDQTPDDQHSSVIADLRKKYREARREARALEPLKSEVEALREFKTQVETKERTQKVSEVFAQTGIFPKLAPLFLKEHEGEVTDGAVLAWAANYDLGPKQEEEERPSFRPTQGGQAPSNLMSRSDFNTRLMDPSTRDDALKAYQEGRVERLGT